MWGVLLEGGKCGLCPGIRCLSLRSPSGQLCLAGSGESAAPGMHAGGSGRMAVVLQALRPTDVVMFLWEATGIASHLRVSLGNHSLGGSCVAVDIQKIECFLVLSLRSHLLDGAN